MTLTYIQVRTHKHLSDVFLLEWSETKMYLVVISFQNLLQKHENEGWLKKNQSGRKWMANRKFWSVPMSIYCDQM
jgi:hypothetical protein